jgi:hypothetical protein
MDTGKAYLHRCSCGFCVVTYVPASLYSHRCEGKGRKRVTCELMDRKQAQREWERSVAK